jgi:hypothetical protein
MKFVSRLLTARQCLFDLRHRPYRSSSVASGRAVDSTEFMLARCLHFVQASVTEMQKLRGIAAQKNVDEQSFFYCRLWSWGGSDE